jgi:hypothetical protein
LLLPKHSVILNQHNWRLKELMCKSAACKYFFHMLVSLVVMWEAKQRSWLIICTTWTVHHTVRNSCNWMSDYMKSDFVEELSVLFIYLFIRLLQVKHLDKSSRS